MSPAKQHVVYLTAEEMVGIGTLVAMLVDGNGRALILERVPVSEAYVELLSGINEKINKRLKEIDERSSRK